MPVRLSLSFNVLGLSLFVAILSPSTTAQESSAFPELYNSEREPGDPISPSAALGSLNLADGFSATLFSAEPDVMNPIAACTDPLGRTWVAENFTYAEREKRFDLELNDRIIVLEDTDQDGTADKRTVFMDNLQVLTGITVGRGGVWVIAPPQLLFIPDADGDLKPDGPPEVKLDGFHRARENYHNFANGISWGPDGWLYGRSGASSPGDMGIPGSSPEDRIPIRGGMWRFHPISNAVEALVQGTTNPWGHDWNATGDLFFINTVNGHFWHCIPGAHFVRPHTIDLNPHSYELIDMHADHWHFDTGKSWTASRDGAANDYGGGHAHIGMMIYHDDVWPESLRGKVFTINMHGRRANVELLSEHGSGYVASHAPDFLISDDEWFRGMDFIPLPDGNVLLLDWSDTGECHEQTGVHRTSGRIFKITYDGPARTRGSELRAEATRSDPAELARLQLSGSEWHARHARQLLTTMHASASADASPAAPILFAALNDQTRPLPQRLRALWGLNGIQALTTSVLLGLLDDSAPKMRGWAIRLLVDDWRLDTAYGSRPRQTGAPVSEKVLAELVVLARTEPAASVRLELASALQRLPVDRRSELATALVQHVGDASDHNIPLMVWYGLIPVADEDPTEMLGVIENCRWSLTRRLIARRIADRSKESPEVFNQLFALAANRPRPFQNDVALGVAAGLAGWRKASQPAAWPQFVNAIGTERTEKLQAAVDNLSILFGDGRAATELVAVVKDGTADIGVRKSALQTLVDSRAANIKDLCLSQLNQRFLNSVAAAGLARDDDPAIGTALLNAYRRFHPSERSLAISIMASRPAWATGLLKAIEAGQIDRTEVSAFQARQMASLGNAQVERLLVQNWGAIRATPAQKQDRINSTKSALTPDALSQADMQNGRAVFQRTCASCHTLFGAGGKLGPDLTGAQRSNMDYLLENIIDPSAVVTKEFRATIILTEDGRVLTGLVTERNENVVTVVTQNETFKVATDEIEDLRLSEQSTMPDGILDQLTPAQIRDLFAYLQSNRQVALP